MPDHKTVQFQVQNAASATRSHTQAASAKIQSQIRSINHHASRGIPELRRHWRRQVRHQRRRQHRVSALLPAPPPCLLPTSQSREREGARVPPIAPAQVANALIFPSGGISRTVGNVTGAAGRGLGDTITGATGSAGKPVGDALGSLGNGVQSGADGVAKGVENAGQWKR